MKYLGLLDSGVVEDIIGDRDEHSIVAKSSWAKLLYIAYIVAYVNGHVVRKKTIKTKIEM